MTLVLVGLPGSGKSTVGRQLAQQMQMSFVDSDEVIEQQIGCSIREFFEKQGECAFRDIEQDVISKMRGCKRHVLATGGGTVLREQNRDVLRQLGSVVYLRSQPEEIERRLRHDTRRPLFQVDDPGARLRTLFQQRDLLYRATAHWIVETEGRSVPALVRLLKEYVGGADRP